VVEELEESPESRPQKGFELQENEAREAYAAGDLPLAAGLYRNLIDHVAPEEQRPRLRQTLAYILFELGDVASARAELEAALYDQPALAFRPELFPEGFVALRNEALESAQRQRRVRVASLLSEASQDIQAKKFSEAFSKISDALKLAPNQPELLYNRALAEQGLGQVDQAEATLRQLLALQETGRKLRVLSLNNLAVLLLSREALSEAESLLRQAVELSDREVSSWFNLGVVLEKQQRLEEAIQAYRRARALQPEDPSILLRLGSIHLTRQEWVEAVGVLYEASRAAPEQPDIWYQLGRAQSGLGNIEGAIQSLQKAKSADPGGKAGILLPALLLLADLQLSNQRVAESIQAAMEAIQVAPESPEAWNLLGLARLKAGDPLAAELAFDRATQLTPTRPEFWNNLGTARLQNRNYPGAELAFRKVLELRPQDPEALRVLRELEARKAASSTNAPARPQPPALGASFSRAEYPQLGLKGIRVERVSEGSPAARAGLQEGDLILRVDGENPPAPEELERRWRKKRGGIKLSLLREGRPVELVLPSP
jgi:tetratricopeptide (TPR) repeat protein